MTVPASWAAMLEVFRPVFRRRGTFVLFTVLATGMVGQTGRRSVVGMLSGARLAGTVSFHAACRFFSQAVWDVDRLGLAAARFVVQRLLGEDAPITVVVDDTLFKRWGRKIHHAFWTHDGAAQGGKKIARGNRWVVAGIVVRLPFCTAPVCLPVLFRLWAGKGSASPVELAGELLGLVAAEFPGRVVHGVGDAAYHGKPLLVAGTTWTTRLPANAALYDLAPPRTGRRGRPALKGAKLGRPADVAADVAWEKVTVVRYGRTESVYLAEVRCIWYGSFGNAAGRCV
ncbi:transposase, partial [Frankia sp. CiP3]|uniref:transposase n=1 Tax=Frankia sp. CiP3 TaxID=2880971 RepID=UPI001EF70624